MKIILIGPQGSGKGTQAKMLSEKYKIPHISVGDIFREAIASGSDLGKKVKKIIDAGELVSDTLTGSIVKERLQQTDCKKGFILDGFPRTIPQAEILDSITTPDVVLDIEVDDESTVKRLSSRWQCKKCGAIYGAVNPAKKKGKCDKGCGDLYQRDDDKPEAIRKRLTEYHKKTKPILDHYKENNNVIKIDGSQPIDDVFKDITSKIE